MAAPVTASAREAAGARPGRRCAGVPGRAAAFTLAMAWGALGAGGALGGCGQLGQEQEAPVTAPTRVDGQGRLTLDPDEAEAVGLETAEARQGPLWVGRLAFGRVVAPTQEAGLLVAPKEGVVRGVVTAVGSSLEAGEVAVTLGLSAGALPRAELAAKRAQLHARLAATQAQLAAAKSLRERQDRLGAQGLTTDAERARAHAAVSAARAEARGLRRAMAALDEPDATSSVVAPVAGTVSALAVAPGQIVRRGQVLGRVVAPGARWVDVQVPADAPPDEGARYKIMTPTGARTARLLSSGATARGAIRTERLLVAAAEAEGLRPGQGVAVRVEHPVAGVVVPAGAVARQGTAAVVFVRVAPGVFVARTVEVLAQSQDRVAISGLVRPGERVVVAGAGQLLGELALSGQGQERATAP